MLLLRRLLQIVFGLLVLAVLDMMVESPTADLVSDAVMVGLFILIILVLGPWWPSPDNDRKWDWALKVNLPTDDPRIAAPLFKAAMGIYSLFHAWEHPTESATSSLRKDYRALVQPRRHRLGLDDNRRQLFRRRLAVI